ncbi:hypothetical protein T265_05269 [Opisthorchis viverrini]|uniref:BZIP domain-containing protein n=1 Tax=Opisthorchis viverrini TaxID=6198 RepID=A0A075AFG6_OPIVI|nr:hypothetical protein T265_05269 [Opisthorchis viverrini]KER27709.1 hypothetical protein T265_05269 [Opisthorchis viverrini]
MCYADYKTLHMHSNLIQRPASVSRTHNYTRHTHECSRCRLPWPLMVIVRPVSTCNAECEASTIPGSLVYSQAMARHAHNRARCHLLRKREHSGLANSGPRGLKAPEVSKADSPDFSESSTSGSERRAYTRTNQTQRSAPNYLRLRSRNNEAVKRFRQKSKNQTRSLEDEIARHGPYVLLEPKLDCFREIHSFANQFGFHERISRL